MKCAIGAARGTARLSGTKHEAFSIAGGAGSGGEEVPVIALDNLLDDGRISADGKYLIKLDVEGVEIEAIKGGTRLLQGDSVLLCEEHGNDPHHTVSRYILEQTPLKLIVYDPRSDRLETVTELSILDRIKVSSHVGYNVFGTASAFWQDRIDALNANAARRCNERLNDNVRPPPRTEGTAARELHVHGGKPRLGQRADRQISGRPPGLRGDRDPVAGPGTA